MTKQTAKLLIVDDEAFNREILEEMLAGYGYQVEMAVDGEDAWSKLDSAPYEYAAVLLDRMMPRLDGMGLLLRMKSDKRFDGLPVIFQTAIDHPEDIAAGIQAGAFYYLVKPINETVLFAIVQSAVNSRMPPKADEGEINHAALANILQRSEFRLRTLKEARSLALALAAFYPDPHRALFGIQELLVNAVEHGNLEISYQEKTRLLQEGNWLDEIQRRMEMPQYAAREVSVVLEHLPGELVLTIADEGQGFDSEQYMAIAPERAFDPNGRGIALSRMSSFDSLQYLDKGNLLKAALKI